ncbi:Flp pilus assembly complex ATPase component TadA [Salinimonas sp. HHU 13199]|uniref:Flp pilus assembly complex ATPase component TadA n=1 Tax=Salinimonas profundi TaxID=2729140 RepID=A0ABR8LTT7_9ALTE|nr:ATPase, T2SS/T4P/T4SS family [Salinimonas profundi]MBD3587554.1 Flp pilus assembly complex ATPase component TadA [Salinimonas profundi]
MIEIHNRFTRDQLDTSLKWAVKHAVNDLIIESGSPLWAKKNGVTSPVSNRPVSQEEVSQLLQDLYLASGPDHLTKGKYLRFAYEILINIDEKHRFRVTATGVKSEFNDNGIELIFRPFPKMAPQPDEIGLPREFVDSFDSDFGVVFVSGPTGSGKSTTIASTLTERILSKNERILTIEDPIEFDFKNIPNRIANVVQSEVPMHLIDYETSTANSLRRSPDIIFYSEVREASVGQELLRVANTGHLVATTLHANTAEMTLPRFVDMFEFGQRPVITGDLIESIRGILNQRLFRAPDLTSRTAVRSWVVFSQSIRDEMYDKYAEGSSFRLKQQVAKAIKDHGLSFIDDLRAKFNDGQIAISDFARAIQSVGEPKDLRIIGSKLDEFMDRGFIDDNDYKYWKRNL